MLATLRAPPTRRRGAGAAKDSGRPDGAGAGTRNEALAAQIAVGATFTYADGTAGELVYARNVMSAGAPWDVRAHHLIDPSFPHNSTADQLYTDQKFESYRVLGVQAGARALTLMGDATSLTPRLPQPPPPGTAVR